MMVDQVRDALRELQDHGLILVVPARVTRSNKRAIYILGWDGTQEQGADDSLFDPFDEEQVRKAILTHGIKKGWLQRRLKQLELQGLIKKGYVPVVMPGGHIAMRLRDL